MAKCTMLSDWQECIYPLSHDHSGRTVSDMFGEAELIT